MPPPQSRRYSTKGLYCSYEGMSCSYDPAAMERVVLTDVDYEFDTEQQNIHGFIEAQNRRVETRARRIQISKIALVALGGLVSAGLMYGVHSFFFPSSSLPQGVSSSSSEGSLVPTAPSNLSIICSNGHRKNPRQCKVACQEASCCFPSYSVFGNESCFAENESVCLGYDPCSVITQEKTGASNPPDIEYDDQKDDITTSKIASQIDIACTIEKIQTQAFREVCESLCDAFACCFRETQTDASSNCMDDQSCQLGDSCTVLFRSDVDTDTGNVHVPSSNTTINEDNQEDIFVQSTELQETCDVSKWKNNAQGNGNRERCEQLCIFASCCFKTEAETESDCAEASFCEEYYPCEVLFTLDFDDDLSMYSQDIDHQSNNVGPEEEKGEYDKKDDDSILDNIDVDADHILQTCALDNISSSHGMELCQNACKYGLCCFIASSEQGSCMNNWRCPDFQPCEVLQSETQKLGQEDQRDEDAPPEAISNKNSLEYACAPESIETKDGKVLCRQVCSYRACCFAKTGASEEHHGCYEGNKIWCDEYEVCRKVL